MGIGFFDVILKPTDNDHLIKQVAIIEEKMNSSAAALASAGPAKSAASVKYAETAADRSAELASSKASDGF